MREVITSKEAPGAIGPYSQAILAKGEKMLFISGQIPLDPESGKMVEGDIKAQTTRVMANLEGVLKAAKMNFSQVAKTTIYLIDMEDFAAVNEVYGQYFPKNPPARATVAVRGLPLGVRVEMDMVAVGE